MPTLAEYYTRRCTRLRGFGACDRPDTGYDKRTVAEDVHQLVDQLGLGAINLVSHDVGMMVGYAYVSAYPSEVKRLILMEAALPGLGWKSCMTPTNINGCIIYPSLKRQTGWQKR